MKKAIIIGGGFTGCTAAYELSKKGWDVTLIEKNSFLGGGCRTFFYGGHPYTNGPRPLCVRNEKIFNYINDIVPMRIFELYLETYIEKDKQFYSYPIHEDDIPKMPDKDKVMYELNNLPKLNDAKNFEEAWIGSIGKILYEKYVNNYTKKMWKVESNTVFEGFDWSQKGTTIKTGSRATFEKIKDKNIDKYAYPINESGYNNYFDFCVQGVKVYLGIKNPKFDLTNKTVYIGKEKFAADIIINTISPDDLMDNYFGKLLYMGRDFIKLVLPVEQVFPENCHFVYYPNEEPFTRIVEYKSLTLHKSNSTLLVIEIPSNNEKLYPYFIKTEQEKAQKYMDNLPKDVYTIGRLGTYKYLNIGDCLENVWKMIEKI